MINLYHIASSTLVPTAIFSRMKQYHNAQAVMLKAFIVHPHHWIFRQRTREQMERAARFLSGWIMQVHWSSVQALMIISHSVTWQVRTPSPTKQALPSLRRFPASSGVCLSFTAALCILRLRERIPRPAPAHFGHINPGTVSERHMILLS